MTRLTISIDTMAALRAAAVEKADAWFNQIAQERFHRDHAHAHKRQVAWDVATDPARCTAEFEAEAALRGITLTALASAVLSKPNHAAQRELARQTLMVRIESAATPADLASLSNNVDFPH